MTTKPPPTTVGDVLRELDRLLDEQTVDAELREAGLDPDEGAARGRAKVREQIEKHKAREYTARDTADFELEHMEVMIRDCWQKLYGTREWPRNMNRRRALGRIRDIIVTSIEPLASPPKPPRRLPLGVVRDDGEAN
jgi:hypothetical protein